MASAPCSAKARAIATASSTSLPPSYQSVAEMRTRHRPVRRPRPPAPRRRPRAGSAAGSPASRRTRRCAGWTAATGTTTAGSRARSAARAGRSRRGAPAAAAATNSARDLVQLGAGQLARHLVGRRVRQRRRADDLPVARRAAARRCPPTSAWSSPCGRSGRAGGRSAAVAASCTKSTIRRHAASLLGGVEPGAARGDPAARRDAHHLGHHQAGAAERLARPGGRGGSRSARRRRPSTCPSARRRPGSSAPAAPSRNGWNIGGARPRPAPAAGEPRVHRRRRTPGRAAAGCRR